MAWHNYRRGNKYHNSTIIRDGERFDSKKEMRRYAELQIMETAGMIHGLKRQKKYVLIPAQREPDTVGKRGGRHKGALIERECVYYADFSYYDREGNEIVEDVKSPVTRTKDYIIKRKLMLYKYGIRIVEV